MKLNNKLLITHVIVGCILLLVTGYYTNVYLREEKFQSIHDSFINQLYQVDFAISSFLVDVEYDVKDLVANEIVRTRDDHDFTSFLEADEETFEYHIGEREQAIIDVLNNYRMTHPYANSVYMGRENGSFVRSHKRNRPTQYDPRQRPWYELAVSNPDEVKRTAPYRSVTTPDVNIGTVKTLVDEGGQVYGVVGIDITLRNLTEYISTIDVGENSFIVLLDDNGIILTGQDEAVRFKRYEEAGLDYFQEVMDNATGYILFEEGDTDNYLFYYTSPALGWKICVIVPRQEIERQVSEFANRIMWILVLSLVLLSVLTTVGVRKFIIKPIKELERSTKVIIETGNLDHRIAIESGDEIGQLAVSFNEMVGSIKRTEEELRASEEKYRSLVENINVGVFRSTAESPGRLLHANSAAVEILGYGSVAEVLDISVDELYENPKERMLLIQRLAQGDSIKDHELRLKKKDGTFIWASLSVTVQHDPDGHIKWLEGVIEDITARKQAEEALRRARDELELRVVERTAELSDANAALKQEIIERTRAEAALFEAKEAAEAANQAKSTFLANMSHELRTPLNAIIGFAQLMRHSPTLPPEHKDNLGIITTSGEHLLTLINQVLDLSKIEAGQTTLAEKIVDLYRLLDDLEGMFRLRAEDQDLHLIFDRTPAVPRYVRTDEVKLRQVLINLLNNALKFTKEGDVSLRVTEFDELGEFNELSEEKTLKTLHVEVEDTGPGIAPEEIDKLFEAFVQTETGRLAQEGTGLGLPISRKFIQLMGGDIQVDSEVGCGATFKFDIQVKAVDQSEIENLESKIQTRVIALEPGQPRYRILIVDDKRDNRQLLIKLLDPLGFELREAKNGQQAVEIWGEWQPHLIWMDMRMPVMDGYEATKQIKTKLETQNSKLETVIIALTASTYEEERAVFLAAGCDDFLRKPFHEADFFEMMHKHIGVRFVYERAAVGEESRIHVLSQAEGSDLQAHISALPPELFTNLEQAVVRIDMEKIDSLIEEVRSHNTALADVLAALADEFKYDQISTLIKTAKENKNE